MTYNDFFIRIILSFIFSLIIGLERQIRGSAIGLRTNVLVSIGSFLFVSFSFLNLNCDVSRIAAQVVSGIGFLGAGVILKDGTNIKGLNTAATMWCDAAIGVLCAGGFLVEALIGVCLILFSNIVLRFFTHRFSNKHLKQYYYDLDINVLDIDEGTIRQLVTKSIGREEIILQNIHSKEDGKFKNIIVSLFTNNRYTRVVENLITRLTENPKVLSLKINRIAQRKNVLDDDE